MSMNILLRLFSVTALSFIAALTTAEVSFADSLSPQHEKAGTPHTSKGRATPVAPVYVPPVYDRKEFQYFTDRADTGDLASVRTELTPLMLAPKFDVQLTVKDGVNIPELKKKLSEKYGAQIIDVAPLSEGLAHFRVELPVDSSQEQLVNALNALSAEADGLLDVVPVFYVDNREAIVSGIITTFAAPFSRRQLEQMLESYGGFHGLSFSESANGLTWRIASAQRRFMLEPPLTSDGTKRAKFDTHLLLLANLLETQKLLHGVAVISARPEWKFLEGPIAAKISVEWPADTVGGVRLLRLEVSIYDTEHVRFDPNKVPHLGSSGFEMHVGISVDTIIPGWSKFAEGGTITENSQWDIAPPKQVLRGGRSVTVYTFQRQFYVFQPEPLLNLSALAVPYEYRDHAQSAWQPMSVDSNPAVVVMLPHRQKDQPIAMPLPPVYPFASSVHTLLTPTEFVRAENRHWFSVWVERGKHWGMSLGMISAVPFVLVACSVIFLVSAGLLWIAYARQVNACKPQAMPFLSEHAFTELLQNLSRAESSTLRLRQQLIDGRNLLEALLIARIPGLTQGQVTIPMMKEMLGKLGHEPRFASVLTKSIELLLLTNIIDAPKEVFPPEVIARDLELLRNGLPALYAALAALPPRMNS